MSPLPRTQIIAIAESYGARNIRIFGSAARGEDRPDSDLDLLIDLEQGRSLLDLIGIKQDLEQLLGRKVDVVTENGLNRYIRKDILSEAVSL